MDVVQVIVEIVSNLGVPVACLVGAFWLLNKEREDHKEEVNGLRNEHNLAYGELIKAINNNTVVIEKLCGRLDND